LTDQSGDTNVTHRRENKLAQSKSGWYEVHQEIKHRRDTDSVSPVQEQF
jgi:hypothetical protein